MATGAGGWGVARSGQRCTRPSGAGTRGWEGRREGVGSLNWPPPGPGRGPAEALPLHCEHTW